MSETTTFTPQGAGLDPAQFLPIATPAPAAPADVSVRDTREETETVSKRRAEKILQEAKDRFKLCQDWEAVARQRGLDDLKFVEADAENGYQWPAEIRRARDVDKRPSLTINKARQHCLLVLNECRQNKPAVKIRATGGGATAASAQVFEGIVRHIEYQSNAANAYDTASEFQIKIGIGYWRVVTDYEAADSFNQEIFIRRVHDPFSVYLDPDIAEMDGSDARFAFVFEDIPVDAFERLHPDLKDDVGRTALQASDDWTDSKYVRVAEYWRRVEKREELLSIADPATGQRISVLARDLTGALVTELKADPQTRTRTTTTDEVEWYLIAGSRVVEMKRWPGRYIPIVRVVGEETVIERTLDRKGHARALKDPQRIYNYWSSGAVENVALQSKTPYVGTAAAFEGYETYYQTANLVNHAFLPFNAYDDNGQKLDPPVRQAPVQLPEAYLHGLQISSREMMAVSGQYEAALGERGDERTGVALQERQRTGARATYHYVDNLATAIRFTGKILLDLIPKIYDTPRVLRILSEDGKESHIEIDPAQKAPLAEGMPQQAAPMSPTMSPVAKAATRIFNPAIGKYEVQAEVGPNFATRRQEAFAAFGQIIAQRPELVAVIGDLLLKGGDFPMADEAAERLRRMVPPMALGEGPPPEVAELQQQVENLKSSLTAALQALSDKADEQRLDADNVAVDAFKAETERLKAFLDAMDPTALAVMVRKTVHDALTGVTVQTASRAEAGLAAIDRGPLARPLGDPDEEAPRDIDRLDDPTPVHELATSGDGGRVTLPDPAAPEKFMNVQTHL